MALRAVSIVGLESSIRAQFDRQIDEIQRNIQVQHQERQNSRRGSRVRANSGQRRGENANSEDNHETSEPNNNNVAYSETLHPPDMQEDGDLGRSTTLEISSQNNASGDGSTSGTRSQSVDIRVEYEAFSSDPAQSENGDSIGETLEQEIRDLSGVNTRDMTCCQFYRAHWIGHLVTGLLSGCLFILIGIIFLVNGSESIPIYAGVTLILLGLAPCCMAMNRYRYARLYERERRRAIRRLAALRRAHRHNVREERRRQRQAHSDLPPAYDNLGFDLGEDDLDIDTDDESATSSSSLESCVLPTYDQCVKKEEHISAKESATIERISEEILTSGRNLNVNNNISGTDQLPEPEFAETSLGNDEVAIVVEPPGYDGSIEIVETRFETEFVEPQSSLASSSGYENNQAAQNTVVNVQSTDADEIVSDA